MNQWKYEDSNKHQKLILNKFRLELTKTLKRNIEKLNWYSKRNCKNHKKDWPIRRIPKWLQENTSLFDYKKKSKSRKIKQIKRTKFYYSAFNYKRIFKQTPSGTQNFSGKLIHLRKICIDHQTRWELQGTREEAVR